MTEEIDWFKIEIYQLEKMIRASKFEGFVDDNGEDIDTALHLCNQAEARAEVGANHLSVAVTDRDDIVLLEDFEKHPFDKNYRVLHLPGLWKFAYEKVYGREPKE